MGVSAGTLMDPRFFFGGGIFVKLFVAFVNVNLGRRRWFLLRIVGRRLFAIMSRSYHHGGPFQGVIPSAPAEPDDP